VCRAEAALRLITAPATAEPAVLAQPAPG
jgi:hypothetical protein